MGARHGFLGLKVLGCVLLRSRGLVFRVGDTAELALLPFLIGRKHTLCCSFCIYHSFLDPQRPDIEPCLLCIVNMHLDDLVSAANTKEPRVDTPLH